MVSLAYSVVSPSLTQKVQVEQSLYEDLLGSICQNQYLLCQLMGQWIPRSSCVHWQRDLPVTDASEVRFDTSVSCAGVRISEEGGMLRCDGRDMHAADIHLDYPSVGATENIIMAAALLPGRTTISNAAREPEIEDLQRYINAMGGHVQGAGSPLIVIEGVSRLHGVTYQPMPDRIATGTYLCAAAITGGQIELTNARPRDLTAVLDKLRAMGCVIAEGEQALYLSAPGNVLYYKNKKSVRFLRPTLKALRTTR